MRIQLTAYSRTINMYVMVLLHSWLRKYVQIRGIRVHTGTADTAGTAVLVYTAVIETLAQTTLTFILRSYDSYLVRKLLLRRGGVWWYDMT